MSAFGTKRTFRSSIPMSAFGGKADIGAPLRNVRFPNRKSGTLSCCDAQDPSRAVAQAQVAELTETARDAGVRLIVVNATTEARFCTGLHEGD